MDAIIHGHFYQPPRENPWSGLIPRQVSAEPAHDWNERVTDECYKPNARSRVLGNNNMIEEIVNNYAFLSWDFGPTLLSWLEVHSPRIYQQIIEGDKISVKLQEGHGNGIAHVYNHIIMPLANYRDKRTQIVWGMRDFEWRFGRKSESLWLAETAINLETVKLMIEFGIRYVILSPFQALRTRPLDRSADWSDAKAGKVDPRRPYRFYLKDSRHRRIKSKYIDVFFYDGQLASDISFGHLLQNADTFADRIGQSWGGSPDNNLVNVATDGEIYGHHEPFADMCLSYVIRRMAPERDFNFTNYGCYLDHNPPTYEADINFGEADEGTAWSCAHGVGRWDRDCGCSTGAGEGWNQKWRTPLRRGFDMVRDRLVETYIEQASRLVKDPWQARDDYILVMLDQSESARAAFLDQHARKKLSDKDRCQMWRLLESQRMAMYMYTSCAWFFADISGIETVQNMAYARRAIDLAGRWQSLDLEERLLEYLSDAQSNVLGISSGADVYRRYVLPQQIPTRRIAGGLALGAAVQDSQPQTSQFRYDAETIRFQKTSPEGEDGAVSYHGLIDLTDRDTEECKSYNVAVFYSEPAEFRCYVHAADPAAREDKTPDFPTEERLERADGCDVYTLQDLVAENQERIIRTAYDSILQRQDHLLQTLFDEGMDLIKTCQGAEVPMPSVLRSVAGHVTGCQIKERSAKLETMLVRKINQIAEEPQTDLTDKVLDSAIELTEMMDEIDGLRQFSEINSLEVSMKPLIEAYGRVMTIALDRLLENPDPALASLSYEVMKSSWHLQILLDHRPLEDLTFQVLGKHRALLQEYHEANEDQSDPRWLAFKNLADGLHLSIDWILAKSTDTPVASIAEA